MLYWASCCLTIVCVCACARASVHGWKSGRQEGVYWSDQPPTRNPKWKLFHFHMPRDGNRQTHTSAHTHTHSPHALPATITCLQNAQVSLAQKYWAFYIWKTCLVWELSVCAKKKKEAQVINGLTNRKQRKGKKIRRQVNRREEKSMSDRNMQEIRNKRTDGKQQTSVEDEKTTTTTEK